MYYNYYGYIKVYSPFLLLFVLRNPTNALTLSYLRHPKTHSEVLSVNTDSRVPVYVYVHIDRVVYIIIVESYQVRYRNCIGVTIRFSLMEENDNRIIHCLCHV